MNAETFTALFIAYSDVACPGNLERDLKIEETCAENEVVCGFCEICRSRRHHSWIAVDKI
jgi:hypothetical protein